MRRSAAAAGCGLALAVLVAHGDETKPPARPTPAPLAQTQGARLEADGTLELLDEQGAERGRLALALPQGLGSVRLRAVTSEGRRLYHLSGTLGGTQQRLELVVDGAGPRVLVQERTGLDADGERAIELRVDERGIVRYQTSPTMRRCDGDVMLFPEAWRWDAGRFAPVIDPPPRGKPLLASRVAPQEIADPPLGVYHFFAESTAAEAERRADRLAAPVELEDGKPDTMWRAGPPGRGEGEWVAARAQGAGHGLKALRVVPGPGPVPPELSLLVGERVFSVALIAGGPSYVVFPDPLAADCVALAIAKAPPQRGSPGTALAEVTLYSELDGAGGLARLVELVAEARPGADVAAHVLAGLKARAAPLVAERLATAHGSGHRRLIDVLAGIARPEDAPLVGRALETCAPEERATLVETLARLGPAGVKEAIRIYGDTGQAPEARADGSRVLGLRAAALGRPYASDAPAALDALLAGAGRGPGPVRVEAVKALGHAVAAAPAVLSLTASALTRAAAARDEDTRIADLARALAFGRSSSVRAEGTQAVASALGRVPDADTRLILTRALGALGDAAAAPVLDQIARAATDDEVLRWAAVEAAAALDSDAGVGTLVRAAGDPDPRVRRAALLGWGRLGKDGVMAGLTPALAADEWPLVRRAAAEATGSACGHAPSFDPREDDHARRAAHAAAARALERAIVGAGDAGGADPAEEVRRAALVALVRCEPSSAAVEVALADPRQPLSVRELAAAQLANRGGASAARALAKALADALADPAADERSAGLAVACLRGLGRARDRSQPVLDAIGGAATEPLSAAVRAAAMEAIGALCPQGAGEVLSRGASDPDPYVRGAAERARTRCR